MRALVTGATGFVGSHLAARLLDEGFSVRCLVRPTSSLANLEGLDVETSVGSLEEGDTLPAALCDVDYVFHAAALTRARTREEYFAVNADGTGRLIEASLRCKSRPRRFVYVSSLAAVGPNPAEKPLDETAAPHPIDWYGQSKLAGERIVLEKSDELDVTIVRPPAVYGPGDTNFLPLLRTARKYRFVPIIGKPSKQVSFVYAADLAEGIFLAASSPGAAGQTYFVGSSTHEMRQVVEAVSLALGMRLRALPIPTLLAKLAGELGEIKWTLTGRSQIISRRKVRDLLQDRWTCSWKKAIDELGYRPGYTLAEGMKQTAQWYIRHGWM